MRVVLCTSCHIAIEDDLGWISTRAHATIGFLNSTHVGIMASPLFVQDNPIEAAIQIFKKTLKESSSVKTLLNYATVNNVIFNRGRVHWKQCFFARKQRYLISTLKIEWCFKPDKKSARLPPASSDACMGCLFCCYSISVLVLFG